MLKTLPSPQAASKGRAHWVKRLFERRGATPLVLAAVAAGGYAGYTQSISNYFLVTVLTALVVYEFLRRVDQGLPLMQIGALLACLQWLIGPLISFQSVNHHGRYFMYVPEDIYFGYAIPATAMYLLGMLGSGLSIRQRPALHRVNRESFLAVGIALNVVAVCADLASGRLPESLAFFFHLLSQLRYVGALYFLLSGHRLKWPLVILSCVQLFIVSGESGMFHDLILWSSIVFTYWFAMQRRDAGQKIAILLMALLGVTVIQLVKQSMREKLLLGQQATFSGELVRLVTGQSDAYSESALTLAAARLNQGWIISAVMANVPQFEEVCDGETVREAVLTSLVPRALWADKKRAGGQDNFRRFTGLPLQNTTSMGISPLGEAYANFGVDGGILFMGALGLALSMSFFLLSRRVLAHPTFLFWIPLIYYQAIKAETELVVVVNQIVKGTVVALAGYWICGQFLASRAALPRMVEDRDEKRNPVV